MAKGISLHIGLNSVDSKHYGGWDGELTACEFDAKDMFAIAKSRGFTAAKLLTKAATRAAVISGIKKAASKLKSGDIFVLSYSGHGGQLPDKNSDEEDGMDETWCLFDGQLVDDELYSLWSKFKKGVRILVFSDSCHSGTVVKLALMSSRPASRFTPRFMPSNIAATTYFAHQKFYDGIMKQVKNVKAKDIQASVKLISGCQDNQESMDGTFNGEFTGALKRVWNGGKFKGNYSTFHKKILNLLPPDQSPNYFNVGKANPAFDKQRPFVV